MKLSERVVATGRWRPQYHEELKENWEVFLPFRITQEETDQYKEEGWSVLHCYDWINGEYTAFK